jgi:elongation factor Ts
MAELSAAQVMALRKKTGLPMMECKQALTECNGDEAAAVEWLSKKHKGKMEARSDRETGEGRIGIYIDPSGKTGGIVELRCETAPVGKNEVFIALANDLAKHVAEGAESAPSAESVRQAMEARMTEVYGKLRETMNIGVCRKVTGEALAAYVHHDGKSGVLLALQGKPSDDKVGYWTAAHATFHKPLAIDRDSVPADQIEKVRADAIDMAKEEGKPEHVVGKIADGRVSAFVSENALMEQEHARTDLYGRKKVKDVLAEHGVTGVTDMAYVAIGA